MANKPLFTAFIIILGSMARVNGQEEGKVAPFTTFKSSKIVNAPSPETHFKRDLNFYVSHRFGDIAGDAGGYHTMFGLDNARDIRIGFEYGITDEWDIAVSRSKGAGPLTELWEGYTKYKLITQEKNGGFPVTLTYYGGVTFSSMERSSAESSPSAFNSWQHRLAYTHQAIIGKKFGDRLSLALIPTFIHRNFVANGDKNNIYAAGIAGTFKVSKMVGIIGEYFYDFPRKHEVRSVTYRNPLGIGVEIETGGHTFQLTLNNAPGLSATQFIPYNTSQWQEGGFRFGFTINRLFQL